MTITPLHDPKINNLKSLSNAVSTEEVSRPNGFAVAIELIEEEEGFNTRAAYCKGDYFQQPEVVEHINQLAAAYAAGEYVPPLIVKVKGGRVFLRDGACRWRAIHKAINELGALIKKVSVLEARGDDAEQSALIATTNNGLQISAMACAALYGRYVGWGWSAEEISVKLGKKLAHVKLHIELLELPLEMKYMVQANELSATLALELYREHGTDALQVLESARTKITGKATEEDKAKPQAEKTVRITKRHTQDGPRLTKKVVSQMHRSFVNITAKLNELSVAPSGDGFVLKLTADEVDELRKLQSKLKKDSESNEFAHCDKQMSIDA